MPNRFIVSLLTMLLFQWSCQTAAILTTPNTTTPVLIGPIKKIQGQANQTSIPLSKDTKIDRDHSSWSHFAFVMGSGTVKQGDEGSICRGLFVELCSSYFKLEPGTIFDTHIMTVMDDTTTNHAEIDSIKLGSYSLFNIILIQFHKAWVGIEGQSVPNKVNAK